MVKIDVVSEAEAWAIAAKGKAGQRIIQAIEALKNLPEGKVLKVTLDNQTAMAWKTAFSRAAVALDMIVEMHVVAGGVLIVRVLERGGPEPEPSQVGGYNYPLHRAEASTAEVPPVASASVQTEEAASPAPLEDATSSPMDRSRVVVRSEGPGDPLWEPADVPMRMVFRTEAPVPIRPPYPDEAWRAVAQNLEKPLIRVLVPHIKVKSKEYCNDLTQHTKHEEQEYEGATWCIWEGPEDRMPDVKGQVIDK